MCSTQKDREACTHTQGAKQTLGHNDKCAAGKETELRGMHTYKELSRHKDTMINVQQAKETKRRRVHIQGAKQT